MDTEKTPAPFLLTVRSPVDLIAAVPYLVGFHPADSLILLGVDAVTSAVDFAIGCEPITESVTEHSTLAERLCAPFVQEGASQALIIGYGSDERITPGVNALQARLASSGVTVVEALRTAEGRYWSYTCHDQGCCPDEGVRYDVHSSTIPATAVIAGLRARTGRTELLALTAPVTGVERTEVERATATAEARRARLWGRLDPGGRRSFTVEGIRAVRAAVTAALDGAPLPDAEAVAWLGVLLVDLRTRDEAWSRIDRDRIATHIGLWSHVLRRVAPAYAAAPAALLAFAAWQNEDPLLAESALDRAAEAEPDYSMARLLRQALRYGVSPRNWRGFSPEWLEAESPVGDLGIG